MRKLLPLLLIGLFIFQGYAADARVRVVTDLTDFAYIAERIGGNRVQVNSLVIPYMDPHFQEPKPSYIVQLNRADLMIEAGVELTQAWLHTVLHQARNTRILPGGDGYVFAGQGIQLLDVPTRQVTRLEGDVHPAGNPHYNYDPHNILIIARNIRDGLIRVDPQGAAQYRQNHDAFAAEWREALERWDQEMAPLAGRGAVMYHSSLRYLFERYQIREVGKIEPRPGIAPSGQHLAALAQKMISENCRVILCEPWSLKRPIELLASRTHSTVVTVSSGVGSRPEIKTLFDMWDYNVQIIKEAFLKNDTETSTPAP